MENLQLTSISNDTPYIRSGHTGTKHARHLKFSEISGRRHNCFGPVYATSASNTRVLPSTGELPSSDPQWMRQKKRSTTVSTSPSRVMFGCTVVQFCNSTFHLEDVKQILIRATHLDSHSGESASWFI